MTERERDESYERYKQWQYNRIRYRDECFCYGLLIVVGFCFAIFHLKEIGIVVIIGGILMLLRSLWKMYKKHRGLSKIEDLAISIGATIERSENGGLAFSLPADISPEILHKFEELAADNGFRFSKEIYKEKSKTSSSELDFSELDMEIEDIDNKNDVENSGNRDNRDDADKMETNEPKQKKTKIKWTEPGTINNNHQRNNGRTGEPGTDNLQYLYAMECLDCGAKYKVNGSNIYECKCPECNGGKAINR